jgi:hypothetical protein
VVGLAAGPVALIGLLGTPQLLVLSLAAFGHGVPEGILAFMAVVVPAAAVLVMLTQIAGHALARRRTPGIVGITLSIALGCAGLFGMTLGMLGDDELLGFLAVIPQMSGFDVLSRVFLPLPTDLEHHLFAANLRLVIGTTCFAVCAGLAAIALRRRIAGRTGPQLQRAEALVGAAVLSAAAVAAVPPELFVHDLSGVYFVSAAIVLLPLQVLLMGRVPVGDGPSRSRIVPLQSLLRDWMLLLTLHFALCALLVGDGWAFERGTPFGIIHVAWTFSVAALIAIRSAAAPLGLWGALWIACCELALTVSFINGAVLILEPDRDGLENIMALSNASPMLGLLQLGSMVVIPVMLADGIRRKTAGIC